MAGMYPRQLKTRPSPADMDDMGPETVGEGPESIQPTNIRAKKKKAAPKMKMNAPDFETPPRATNMNMLQRAVAKFKGK